MRVLFATTVLPDPTRSGGEVVSAAFVEALGRAGAHVDVMGYARRGAAASPPQAQEERHEIGSRAIESAAAGRFQRGRWLARALLTADAYSVAKYRSRAYTGALRRVGPWDLAIVDHAQMARLMRHVGRPVALLAHNAEAAHYVEIAAVAGRLSAPVWRREARHVGRLEQRAARAADELWALTRDDARELGGRSRVFAVPAAVRAPRPAAAASDDGPDVALLGSWTWRPNLEGLSWFRREVLPRLDPGLRVHLAGHGAELAGPWPSSVALLGRVEDATAFLAGARVVAVPAVAGTGVQVKTLDAIASGSAVVATPVALRGIDDPPSSVSTAQDAAVFAAALNAAARAVPSTAGIEWGERRRATFEAQVADGVAALAGAG